MTIFLCVVSFSLPVYWPDAINSPRTWPSLLALPFTAASIVLTHTMNPLVHLSVQWLAVTESCAHHSTSGFYLEIYFGKESFCLHLQVQMVD